VKPWFVDQEHNQKAVGVVGRDRVRDVLHQHGLAGTRRRRSFAVSLVG
jgi:hypothetical protein